MVQIYVVCLMFFVTQFTGKLATFQILPGVLSEKAGHRDI